jgi:hypothetical protein
MQERKNRRDESDESRRTKSSGPEYFMSLRRGFASRLGKRAFIAPKHGAGVDFSFGTFDGLLKTNAAIPGEATSLAANRVTEGSRNEFRKRSSERPQTGSREPEIENCECGHGLCEIIHK